MDDSTRQRQERALWAKQAASYDRRTLAIYQAAYAASIAKAVALVNPASRVLEIGCGTGIISLGLAPHVQHLLATDISPEMIAVAERKAQQAGLANITFSVADGYHLPYPEGSFDVVLLFNTLHVVQTPAALLAESHRLLAPGGVLATATDCYAEPVPLPQRLLLTAQLVLKTVGVIPFMAYYHKQELEALLQAAGLVVVDRAALHAAPLNWYVAGRKSAGRKPAGRKA